MAEASDGPFVRRGFAGFIDSAKARNSEGLVSSSRSNSTVPAPAR